MTVTEYQTIIEQTAVYPKEIGILYCTLGLCGEAGEVSEKIKKIYRDNPEMLVKLKNTLLISEEVEEVRNSLKKEIGDVIWYCTALASEFDISLEDVMATNYTKLLARKATNTLHGSGDNREVAEFSDGNGY